MIDLRKVEFIFFNFFLGDTRTNDDAWPGTSEFSRC